MSVLPFIYMNGDVSHLWVSWVLYKIEAVSTLVWESHEERKSSWLSLINAFERGKLDTKEQLNYKF